MAELLDAHFSVDEVVALAKTDPDFLAGIAMPEIAEYAWPPIFIGVWFWLLEQVGLCHLFPKLALGLPRGFGKTTIVKLFILYCILFTDRKFIIVVSATASHAENIIADVADMLDEPNIKAVFGNWRLGQERDTNALKKFGFRGRDIILAGLGAGGSMRGLNLKNARPDVMIFEDVQTREQADSQQVSEDLYKWMLGTAMKAKSPKGCLTLFIANMYPTPHSILKKLKVNSQWTKFIAGGIMEDGTSLWEQLQPFKQLLKEYQNDLESGHPEIFHAEVLNDENASVNNLVDLSKLPTYPFLGEEIHGGNFIIIDPATDKANADAVSIGYFEVHEGLPCIIEVTEGRLSPKECILESLRLGMKNNCSLIVIEGNAYQSTLGFWSKEVCKDMGIIGFNFVEIYSGKMAKNARILTMLKSYAKGELYVHPQIKAIVHPQISGFNPLKTNNVDGILDLLTYSTRVIEEFADLIAINTVMGIQEFEKSARERFSEIENSPF